MDPAFYPFCHMQIASPEIILQQFPLSKESEKQIAQSRKTICNILSGKDRRLLLIVGPCSIHDQEATLEYAEKLKGLSDEVQESFFICLRTYVEKSRTLFGWKGYLHDPDLDESYDIEKGIGLTRSLLVEIAKLGLSVATEFVDPIAARFFQDLVSWGCIGARCSQSPISRRLASSLDMPVGFKNKTDGDIEVAIGGACVAKCPHTFLDISLQGQLIKQTSRGNIFPHIVLRGGKGRSNFDRASIATTAKLLKEVNLPGAILIDCSHDNCQNICSAQRSILLHIIEGVIEDGSQSPVRGAMIESFLYSGSQKSKLCCHSQKIHYGISCTDPCLDWQTTQELILQAHELFAPKVASV